MNNLITGTPNNDILSGGNTDTLAGGAGDDTYRLSGQDAVILEAPGEGRDLVVADNVKDYVLPDNVEDLIISPYYTGAILPIHGTGNDLDNVITAQAMLQSYLVAVGPHGQTSGPPYSFFDSHVIAGGRGNDTLTAAQGDDTLDGGEGDDLMSGGAGADTYIVDSEGDRIVEGLPYDWASIPGATEQTLHPFTDIDTVRSSINYTLGDNLENLALTGQARIGQGNILNNVLTGNELDNQLKGLAGSDALLGGDGQDTLIGGLGNDTSTGGEGADIYLIGANDGQDLIHADAQDAIQLGAGVLRSALRAGYSATGPAAVVLQLDASGQNSITLDQIDQWRNGLTLSLADGSTLSGQDLLNLIDARPVVGGPGPDALTGTTGRDTLEGLGGNDTLDGALGDDLLIGGLGDDLYLVDQAGDQTIEVAGQGTDTVISSVSWILGDALENLTLKGAATTGQGNDFANVLKLSTTAAGTLQGGGGNDTLHGHGVGDVLQGGTGDDLYELYVTFELISSGYTTHPFSSISGQVQERWGEGVDEVRLTGNNSGWYGNGYGYTLPDHIEKLTLIGDAVLPPVTGNAQDNQIQGSQRNDTIAGGWGRDTLDGGAGADLYQFTRGDGQDLIQADATDKLWLAGIARSDLAVVTSGTGADTTAVLSIKGGTDSITLAHADQLGAFTVAFADDGGTATLAQLQAAAVQPGVNLSGTTGKDVLTGKAGDDTLTGLAGNDTLTGGLGNDRLIGGKGADTYLFNRGDGQDTIVENDTSLLNTLLSPDLLKIGSAKANQLWLSKSGNNLDIAIIGTTDKVTIQDWYKGSAYQVEKITALGDNKSLSASKVNALVNAMAKFTAPADGVTTLPAATQTGLNKILASSWA